MVFSWVPSSAASERVFALVKNLFGVNQLFQPGGLHPGFPHAELQWARCGVSNFWRGAQQL
eukprot:4712099-Prymnesium_polylepis.1